MTAKSRATLTSDVNTDFANNTSRSITPTKLRSRAIDSIDSMVLAEDRAGEPVSLLSFIPVAEHAAILAGTSTYDASDDFDDAIAAATYNTDSARWLILPPGRVRLGRPLNLKKQIRITGNSGAGSSNSAGATRLLFSANSHGIIIHRFDTNQAGIEDPSTTGADSTILENFCLQQVTTGSTVGHAVWARSRFLAQNLRILDWAENGYNIVATSGGGGTLEGNANNWRIMFGRVTNCGGDGLFLNGADVNAGLAIGLDCSDNGGWAINDGSFLGNTYVGCHAHGNDTGAYQLEDANARGVLLGCYSEGGQPASHVVAPNIAIGGLQNAGFTAGSTGARWNDSIIKNAEWQGGKVEPTVAATGISDCLAAHNSGSFNSTRGARLAMKAGYRADGTTPRPAGAVFARGAGNVGLEWWDDTGAAYNIGMELTGSTKTASMWGGAVTWTTGTGSPEGVVTAPVGSLFTRTDGGANTTLYVKQSGTGNSGWAAK